MDEQITVPEAGFLEAAVQVGQTIGGVEERGEILATAASLYAEAGQTDLADELAQTIDDSYQRDLAFGRIAVSLVAAGAGTDEELLEMIGDDAVRNQAIEEIAVVYARNGQIDEAIEIAQRLDDNAAALSGIARSCPSPVSLQPCIEVARSIDYPELQVKALIELAGKARQMEAKSEAAELIEEAASATESIEFAEQRIEALASIARYYKETSQSEAAAAVLKTALDDCAHLEGRDRDVALEQIVTTYAELREFDRAEELLEKFEDPFEFSRISAEVAFENHQAGRESAAVKLLVDALQVATDEPVYGEQTLIQRRSVLANLAQTYAAIGRIEDALRVTQSLDDQEQRDASFRDIAITLARSDELNSVFEVIEKVKEEFARVMGEVALARICTERNHFEQADRLLGKAFEESARIERPYQRATCLAELAEAYSLREQTGRAAEILCEALKTSATISSSYFQARVLLGLAVKHRDLKVPAGEAEQQILDEIIARSE